MAIVKPMMQHVRHVRTSGIWAMVSSVHTDLDLFPNVHSPHLRDWLASLTSPFQVTSVPEVWVILPWGPPFYCEHIQGFFIRGLARLFQADRPVRGPTSCPRDFEENSSLPSTLRAQTGCWHPPHFLPERRCWSSHVLPGLSSYGGLPVKPWSDPIHCGRGVLYQPRQRQVSVVPSLFLLGAARPDLRLQLLHGAFRQSIFHTPLLTCSGLLLLLPLERPVCEPRSKARRTDPRALPQT